MMRKLLPAAIALLGVALAVWFVLTVRNSRDTATALRCNGNLCGVGIAMHNYHDKYGHCPPAFVTGADGKPWHSWRVMLLEFLDPELFAAYRFDEPWDGPHNRTLAGKMPKFYGCPADPDATARSETNYFVVVGPGTPFAPGEQVTRQRFTSSPDTVILVVEATGRGVNWLEPADISLDAVSASSFHATGPLACMADTYRRRVGDVPTDRLREMCLFDR